MFSKIAKGYRELFSSVLKILLLLGFCVLSGAAFVLPLWKFAVSVPETYTAAMIVLSCAAVIYLAVKTILAKGLRHFLILCAKIFIIAGGIVLCAALVLSGKRFLSIPVIVCMILFYGILSYGIKDERRIKSRTK